MYENLLKTVTNLGSPKILLIGDFMLDVYVYGDALRISPEAPVPILKVKNTEYSCGGAASVAMDMLALGAKVSCLGITGQDKNAEILKELLKKAGADTNSLIVVPDRPTTTKQRLIGLAQHRHRQQLMRMDSESTEHLPEQTYSEIERTYNKALADFDVVCLQDYNKGLSSKVFCKKLIETAKQAGKKILIDPASINDYSKYTGAALITPNRQETSMAVGFDIESEEDAKRAAEKLSAEFGVEAVIITLDKSGAYLHTKDISELVPTRERNVYDVTGAGDMVLAMLATALASGCDYKTSVQLANIAGGIEVEKFGVATVTVDEIVNEIISVNRGKTGKIRTTDAVLTELDWYKKQGEKIVFTNGCFDVIHRGHIEYLKFCKEQGDVVVLGLNSDSSVKQIKGPERPINNQHDRAAVLAAMESIDYIIIFDEPDPLKLIERVKPDILVKGKDWEDKGIIGREFVEANGGKVVLAPLVEGKSSTDTINKMKSMPNE
ncbi:MAG: D-glycero-beta-D-manno-heptose 1-phosphate adenylyltransferase [Sedimentisphaerales bacterium]|nr:D-glycero-beta-D-manno-heptose 1-phosphate adenylyltransferase [Sedimentisphaerales bacterium]